METSPSKRSISEMEECERPRERLLAFGPAALSDVELLAILIGSGSATENAVELMRRILRSCGGSLKQLGRMDVADFCAYNGIGPAKALTLIAACELGKRRAAEGAPARPALLSSADMYRYLCDRMTDLSTEEFHVLLLNNRLVPLSMHCISRGGLVGTVVDVRLVLRTAIMGKATAIAVCHNHPSGDPRPSVDDDRLTERLGKAAKAVDIRFLDHIIVGADRYYSYADEGKLSN